MVDKKTEIAIVDDHGLVLEGLKSILNDMPQIGSVQAVFTGEELVRLLKTRTFDIYILDIELSGMNGFDVIKEIRAKDKKAHIIINTMHEEIWIINKLIQSNVDSVILKTSDTEQIKNAIQAALDGKSYFCPRFEHIRHKLRHRPGSKLLNQDVPTPREREVLKAILFDGVENYNQGAPLVANANDSFAKSLVMLKFGAKNSTDLVVKALASGYLTISI